MLLDLSELAEVVHVHCPDLALSWQFTEAVSVFPIYLRTHYGSDLSCLEWQIHPAFYFCLTPGKPFDLGTVRGLGKLSGSIDRFQLGRTNRSPQIAPAPKT